MVARKKQTKSVKKSSKKVVKNPKGKTGKSVKAKSEKIAKKKTSSAKEKTSITPKASGKSKTSKTKTKSKSQRSTKKKSLLSFNELDVYKELLEARLIDEKIIVLYKQNKCHFQIGCSGHELPGIVTGKIFRPGVDWFYPYYRDLALCRSLGMSAKEFFLNALNKQDDPNSHGRQMPAHFGDVSKNIVNQSSPTGSQFLQAVGTALGAQKLKKKEAVYVSSGEGTCAQGDFHEALNWAARDALPLLFMIQNNSYAISVHVSEQLAGESVYKLTAGYEGLHRFKIDGTNITETTEAVKKAHDLALAGKGPSLIEAYVPRLQSHSISDNHLKYRKEKDIKAEQKRCPLVRLEKEILAKKLINKKELTILKEETKKHVDESAEWAEQQADPTPQSATEHVYPESIHIQTKEGEATGADIYMVDALNHALDEELDFNEDMLVFGQDVAHGKGGVFTVTAGLTDKYGVKRVFNSQLAESSIAGVTIGLACRGLRPVAEIQFGDYIWTAMNQIRNELAMMHYRSGGDFSCPAVIRVAVGGYIRGACYHSQNIEATFSHFPGLVVVYPSNATDAKGLLKSSIRSHNPVLFLEHKGLYRQVYAKGPEGDANCFTPIGKAKRIREGSDLTIITWGALVQKSLLSAKELEREGASIDVIDLRTITPFDKQTVFESVKKTGRVLIAHEDVEFMGFGAEIAAQIADSCFQYLDAPVKRVAMKNVSAVPHAPFLEDEILPQVWDVLGAARDLLLY